MAESILLLGRDEVTPVDAAGAVAILAARDPASAFAYVVPINAQVMILGTRPETGLAPAMAGAWMRLNDSQVLSRLHRWATGETVPVAPGSDVALLLLRTVIRPDDPLTIIGGGPRIVPALQEKFGLRRIAQHEPPMGYIDKPEAREAALRFAEEHPARFVLVATGAPRSEILMAEMQRRGRLTGTGMAVGSGLLFAAGLTQRAPEFFRRNGIEWMHRAWTEPLRLGRRYLEDLPPLLRLAWRARRAGLPGRASPGGG